MANLDISTLNQNLISVQGTEAKQVLFQVTALADSGPFKTYVSLKDHSGNPINFDQVFESLNLSTESSATPGVMGPYEMTGAHNSFQYGPSEGFSYVAGTIDTTSILPVIKSDAAEGDYTMHIEILNAASEVEEATDVTFKVVSVQTALTQYEELLATLSGAEIAEIEAQYATLESLRQVVNAAILSLPAEDQPALTTRYFAAADNQYGAYKTILMYRAATSELNVAKVRNVGGNTPFSIIFKDEVEIGSASEAYLFYPEGYREAQTGITGYPDDQPDNIKSTLVPGQTSLVVSNTNVKGGEFLAVFKIGEEWFKATYTLDAAGTNLIAVNGVAVSVPNNGDEWLSPLETAMKNAAAGTTMTMTIAPDVADLEDPISATVTMGYPVYDAAIDNTMLLDALITANRELPVGGTITLNFNGTEVGTHVISNAGVKEFFLSEAFGIPRTAMIANTGTHVWTMTFTHFAAGITDFTIKSVAAKAEDFNIESSRYVLASFTEDIKIVDRRAALDAAIAGTDMGFTGDVIKNVGETVEIAVTTAYPTFSVDLDPALAVDTLISMSKAIPVGATVQVLANGTALGTYTEVAGTTQNIWLNDIINAANVRPNLADRNNQTVAYTFVFSGLVDSDYTIGLKAIAALQGNFGSVDARYTLAEVAIPMVVTDKSILAAKIAEAEALLVAHQPGENPGCAATVPRMNLQTAVDAAKIVRDNGDASRNDVLNSITSMTTAITDFKSFVVKWRVNKAALQTVIDTAEDLFKTTTAGTQIGQASAESIATYQAAYDAALNTLQTVPDFVDYFDESTFNAHQAQIDAAKETLDTATVVFQDAIVSNLDYATAKVTEYETAARAFYDSIRKKIRI